MAFVVALQGAPAATAVFGAVSFRAALQQTRFASSSPPADADFDEVSQIDTRVDALKKDGKEAGVRLRRSR